MDRAPANSGIPLERSAALPRPRSRSNLWHHRHTPIARYGHPGQAHRAGLALAEWLCRTADRIDPARVRGSFHHLRRGASTPHPANLCLLLQRHQNALVIRQRCAGLAPCSADWINKFTRDPWRASSPIMCAFRFSVHTGGVHRFLQIHTHVNVAQEKLRRPGLNDILYLIFKFAVTLRKSFAALTPWLGG